MGLGGIEGPPKKKLKQAQLNFCVSTEKPSNKRKLSDSSDGLAPKLLRTDPGTLKTPKFNKENVVDNAIDKSNDDVQKKMELKSDAVVVLDDDSKDDKLECGVTQDEGVKQALAEEEVIKIEDDDGSQGSENGGDRKSETEPTHSKPMGMSEATVETSQSVEGDLTGDSIPKDEAESTESKAENHQGVKKEVNSERDADSDSEKDRAELKLDKSADSEQGEANTSVVLSSEDDQVVSSQNLKTTPSRKFIETPKSSIKKVERERQREEKLRLKREKEEQKRKEKEEKEKKKQEELRLKEDEKKRKEEERKRKEEERKRREEERKKKEEAKEEDRRKKEEEKKKKEEMKEEDRRKKEEARLAEERKENLAKAAFTKFFITEKSKPSLPKKDETEAPAEKAERSKFMPFPVKSDMRLAMQVRRTLTEEEKQVLSEALASGQSVGDTYLKELKNGRTPKTSPATWPLSDEQHDVIIVEFVEDDKADLELEAKSAAKSNGQRAKLMQFHENRRPPYWGTWRKPSKTVGPRRPFGQDKILDYEIDSDSEWEDEEEGEDIEKEDGDSDKEEADDENVGENGYVLDNTFVPHGYLSDEEAAEAEEDDSVEDQKLKLTVLKQEFDQELKSKTQRLQPRLLGCVYIPNTTLEVSKSIYEPLMKLRCKWDYEPIDVTSPAVVECTSSPSMSNAKFPSTMVERLAKLIHGNRSSMKALISEFMNSCEKDMQLSAVSKRAVFLKMKEIAAKTYSSGSGRLVWAVNPDLCAEYGLQPIVDPPKMVPVVPPVVDPPKPKDSPLVNFLKKSSTPQAPVRRVSTTLIPRDGPFETPSSRHRTVHIDTPRPKFTSQGSIVASHPEKPIRRVSTTLLSSIAGPVKNKTFNVCEIDKPDQSSLSSLPKTKSAICATVDLSDSNDGITPLPDEANELVPPVLATCNLANSPVGDSADPPVPASNDLGNPPKAPIRDATNPFSASSADKTTAGTADPPCQTFEPIPMETDSPASASDDVSPAAAETAKVPGPATTDLADASPSDIEQYPMETDDPNEPPTTTAAKLPTVSSDAKPPIISSDANVPPVPSDARPPTVSSDSNLPIAASDAKPPIVSSDAKPQVVSSDAKLSTLSSDAELSTFSSDAKPSTVYSDGKPPEAPKSIPSTPTPTRKRVPLVSLSKCVSKTRNAKPPKQIVLSVADMFCRKPAKKDAASKPSSLATSTVVDLSTDSN